MGTAIVAFLQLYIVYRQKIEKSITFVDFSKKYQGIFGFCTLNYMRFAGEYSQGQYIWANLYFGQYLSFCRASLHRIILCVKRDSSAKMPQNDNAHFGGMARVSDK